MSYKYVVLPLSIIILAHFDIEYLYLLFNIVRFTVHEGIYLYRHFHIMETYLSIENLFHILIKVYIYIIKLHTCTHLYNNM